MPIMEVSRWFAPPHDSYKMSSDAVVLIGKVEIGAIVRDSKGDVLLTVERHFHLAGTIELVEAITMFKVLSQAIEASI